MQQPRELIHLERFLQVHFDEDTGIVTKELKDELKYLLRVYMVTEGNEDFTALIDKIERLEFDNQQLKTNLADLDYQMSKTGQKEEKYKEKLTESKLVIDNINTNYESQISEMSMSIADLENEGKILTSQLEQSQYALKKSQELLGDLQNEIVRLKKENKSIKEELESIRFYKKEEHENIQGMLDNAKEELVMTRSQLERVEKKNIALSKNSITLKKTSASNENLISIYQTKMDSLKDEVNRLNAEMERVKQEKEEDLNKLIDSLKQSNLDQNKLNKLLRKHNKLSIASFNPIMTNEDSFALETLKDYDDIFNQSYQMLSCITTPKRSKSPIIRLNSQNFNDNGQKFNFNDIDEDLEDELYEAKISKSPVTEVIKDKIEKKLTKEDIEKNINDIINERKNCRITMEEIKEFSNENSDKKIDKKQDSESASTCNLQTKIGLDEFNNLLNFVEEYLKSDKNPTSFILSNYEKKRISGKFYKNDKKDIHKFLKLIFKLFIYQIHFLEGHLSNMTKSNSYYQTKSLEYKEEMNRLVKKFLAQNKVNQCMLNDAIKESKISKSMIEKMYKSNVQLIKSNEKKKIKKSNFNKKKEQEVDDKERYEEEGEESTWKKFSNIFSF